MTEKNEQEIEISTLWRSLRRRLPLILGTAALLGAGTYAWSRTLPPVYSASASMLASGSTGQASSDPLLGTSTVRATPLPEGALAQAMQSSAVINPLINQIQASRNIPDEERTRLIDALRRDLATQRLSTVQLSSRVEPYTGGSGIYTVTAKGRTPQTAATLANLAAASLRQWDIGRALEGIKRAEAGYRAQLLQIDSQLKAADDAVGRETLIARRSNVLSSLTQVGILRDSVTGVLTPLAEAVPPLAPEAPRPLRNAVLVALLTALLGSGLAVLRTLLDRTVRREDDITALGLRNLASLPRLRERDIAFSGIVRAARQAGLYEAIGFLRVNLLDALRGKQHPIALLTSTAPGEGKSSITATLADGLAASGQKVLIIDADLRRGTQEKVWSKFNETGQWVQLTGTGGARTTREAFANPENVQVLEVEPGLHMLPAGPSVHDSLSVFNRPDLTDSLDRWRVHYDVVLIDSAPLLALADGLVLGRYADAVVLITEHGRTPLQAIRSALRRAQNGGLNVIGAVINKVGAADNKDYGYSYGYTRQS